MKTKILNVRISDKMYASLSDFAMLSDRSMSQICRYAISSLDSDAPIQNPEIDEKSGTTTVSFRITETDINFVNKIASTNNTSVSDTVRFALSSWLSSSINKETISSIKRNSSEANHG